MTGTAKRVFSLFLCLVLCLGLTPVSALAAEIEPVSEEDPLSFDTEGSISSSEEDIPVFTFEEDADPEQTEAGSTEELFPEPVTDDVSEELDEILIPIEENSVEIVPYPDDSSSVTPPWKSGELFSETEPTDISETADLIITSEKLETGVSYKEVSFSTTTSGTSGSSETIGFVYSDSFLLGDNTTFSPELAKISIGLASAAYNWNSVKNALSGMGYSYSGYGDASGDKGNWARQHTSSDNDFVRYVIATTDIGEYRVYCVVVQGTSGSYDWCSNFNIGDGPNHAGFYLAHDEIMNDLAEAMSADEHSSSTRIVWTTGHSRGAAVSNIVAGELTAGYSPYVSGNHVFGYHFACPLVSKDSEVRNSDYRNIFVFNSQHDLIPEVPLVDWGYCAYGQTVEMPLSELENVASRFSKQFNTAYQGTYDTTIYIVDTLKNLFPTTDSANAVLKPVLRALALSMKGELPA